MSAPVEAVLSEIGKAFRLCRFYPATHPSVQAALAGVSSVLPDLAKAGPVELKITHNAFLSGTRALAPRNPPVQELASLLFTQGHRYLQMDPGLTVEEISALIRAAMSGAERAMQVLGGQAAFEALPHIRLERVSHRAKPGAVARASGSDAPVMSRASMQVFRPDALPPGIEVKRLLVQLPAAAGEEGETLVTRIGALLPELAAQRELRLLALAAAGLGQESATADALTSQAASLAMDRGFTTDAVAALVSRLLDPRVPADERDETVRAVACLGARAIGPVADAYMSDHDGADGEILLAVIRRAGPDAAPVLMHRVNPDAKGEIAVAQARLLGATGSPDLVLLLGAFAVHADARVREAAIRALSGIASAEASRFTITALRDPDPAVRIAAAHGIAWFGDASAAAIIVGRLEEEDDEDAALALIDCLGELRHPGAVPVLSALTEAVAGVFQRHKPAVRVAAVKALAAIGTDDAVAVVQARRASRNEDVRQAALEALTP